VVKALEDEAADRGFLVVVEFDGLFEGVDEGGEGGEGLQDGVEEACVAQICKAWHGPRHLLLLLLLLLIPSAVAAAATAAATAATAAAAAAVVCQMYFLEASDNPIQVAGLGQKLAHWLASAQGIGSGHCSCLLLGAACVCAWAWACSGGGFGVPRRG
jgi:hypothetical protein